VLPCNPPGLPQTYLTMVYLDMQSEASLDKMFDIAAVIQLKLFFNGWLPPGDAFVCCAVWMLNCTMCCMQVGRCGDHCGS